MTITDAKKTDGMNFASPQIQESHAQDFRTLDLAFLGSLLPGIIHNWATPLSGVIGATQLLEKRATVIGEILTSLDEMTEAERGELRKQLERNQTNVEILSRNAQNLADQLQVLVYRITRGSGVARDCFPLNELVDHELRFLEANLQFKHKVRKNLKLESAETAASFCYGFVAMLIDEFVTYAMSQHDFGEQVMEMSFGTGTENDKAKITLEARMSEIGKQRRDFEPLEVHFQRLEDDGWIVERTSREDFLKIVLSRPRRSSVP